MNVIKRRGKVEEFDIHKIITAVQHAFAQSGEQMPDSVFAKLAALYTDLDDNELIEVEQIQNDVERVLMQSEHTEVAKNYIIYRWQHQEAREVRDRLDYMEEYSKSSENAAASSETDANANISMKNVTTLEGEVPKMKNRVIQRQRMKDSIERCFPNERDLPDQYIKDIKDHIFYPHDEASSPVPKNYCEAVTLFPLLYKGIKGMDGVTPSIPQHLASFCGQFNNLVFLLSAQCKGAVAFGEFFNFFDYFCVKDYGENYPDKENMLADSPAVSKPKTIGQKIEDAFQTIVYYINQPAQNRGWQSPFTNVSYYDKYYWGALFGDFYFPDGTQPKWERVSYLQKKFMKWFNKERTKAMLTFPVETLALLTDENGVYLDDEYKDFGAEMYAEGHGFFSYISDNPNSLSSCCFNGNEIIRIKENDSWGYVSIKDYVESHTNEINQFGVTDMKYESSIMSYDLNGNTEEAKITGVLKKLYTGDMYKIEINGKVIEVTEDHPLMVMDKKTSEVKQILAKHFDKEKYLLAVE